MQPTYQNNKWVARISWEGELVYLGRYVSKDMARTKMVETKKELLAGSIEPRSGRYGLLRGISRRGQKWTVRITWLGERIYVGSYSRVGKAIKARDLKLDELRKGKQ